MATNTDAILKLLSKSDALEQIAGAAGLSTDDASKVLSSVLPELISGAKGQASNKDTAASFLEAIMEHGEQDDSDISKLIKNVDVADGAKIVKHLLGSNNEAAAEEVTKKSGIDAKKVAKVMAIAAPIILNQMGKAAKKSDAAKAAAKKTAAKKADKTDKADKKDEKKSEKKTETKAAKSSKNIIGNLDAGDVADIVKDLSDGVDAGDVVSILGKLF